MSAYIVEDSTIDKVVTGFVYGCFKRQGPLWWPMPEGLMDQGAPDLWAAGAKVGQKLLDLNVAAVAQRYNEPASYRDYNHHVTLIGDPDDLLNGPVTIYKAANCLLYQMSEGTVPQDPLYKAFEAWLHHLAHAIVCAMPLYEQAAWG